MVMLLLSVMVRGAVIDPVLRPGVQAQQYRRINLSPRRAEDAHAGTDFPGQSLLQRGQPVRRDQIGLVEQDTVGAGKLTLAQFLELGRASGRERMCPSV